MMQTQQLYLSKGVKPVMNDEVERAGEDYFVLKTPTND